MNSQKQISLKNNGFTLIEVLVALLVMSVGLLGLAALQATSLKASHGAYNRGQATFMAYDMMDRMRANRTQAIAGAYNGTYNNGTAPAAAADVATQDLNDWLTNYVYVLLPAAQATINCTTPAIGNNQCQILLIWSEGRLGGTATGAVGTDGDANTAEFTFTSQI